MLGNNYFSEEGLMAELSQPESKIGDGYDIQSVLNIFESLSDAYDMNHLVERLRYNFEEECRLNQVRRISCEFLNSDSVEASLGATMHFTIYETEGPEFDNIMRQFELPDGQIVQLSLSFMNFRPSDSQLIHGKLLCELAFLYISRAKIGGDLKNTIDTDVVTGVPNTKAFFAYGDLLFAEWRITEYAVLSLNISNFKFVNQVVPFDVGTSVLVRYAHELMTRLQPDELITRNGGDKFTIIVNRKNLEVFLARLERPVSIDIKSGTRRVHFELDCNVGVYVVDNRISIQQAVENATYAMSIAKRNTHQQVAYYTDEIGEVQHKTNQVRASFDHALESYEFVAYYQPKVNALTQKMVGMEALVRWINDGEVKLPSQFVPILESGQQIMKLDRYMLRQVCRDISKWKSYGIDIPRISVNFSRSNLQVSGVATEIAAIIDEYNVDHSLIEIEITETVDNAEFDSLAEFIAEMKKNGIKVAIDDFGTGYSSLNLLRRLNADVLKIDKSFIDIPEFTKNDKLLVGSIVKLAKAYNMEVITEGVESEEQLKFLLSVGCENIQGYFFDRPLSMTKITKFFRETGGQYSKEIEFLNKKAKKKKED